MIKKARNFKLNKYDILEITWLDSHSGGGWQSPSEVKEWIKNAEKDFIIKTVGYFIHEDKDFLRVAQSHDSQGQREDRQGDNLDELFAIAKNCIVICRRINKQKDVQQKKPIQKEKT